MRIFRTTNPQAIHELEPYIDHEVFDQLASLISDPLRCLCLIAAEENDLYAFAIAVANEKGYTTIYRLWCDPSRIDSDIVDRLFFRICFWTDTMGFEELRWSSMRDNLTFLDKYGAEEMYRMMKYYIPENFELEGLTNDKGRKTVRDHIPTSPDRGSSGEQDVPVVVGEGSDTREGRDRGDDVPTPDGASSAKPSVKLRKPGDSSKHRVAGRVPGEGNKTKPDKKNPAE